MKDIRAYIQSQIDSRRKRIDEIDNERRDLIAAITALEDTLAQTEPEPVKEVVMKATEIKSPDWTPATARGRRKLGEISDNWATILVALYKKDKAFTSEDVVRTAHEAGIETSTVNARSQIAIYRGKKILDRIRKGKYRVRKSALVELGLMKEESPGHTPGPNEIAEVRH